MKKSVIRYTIIFIVLTVLCFFCFWHNGLLPIYGIDGLGQYYPAFCYIGGYLRGLFGDIVQGGSIRLFDLNIGMGEDVIGTLNYYGFGDPLNIAAAFAGRDASPYVFSLLYHLRMYLGGLCFMLYCRRFRISDEASVISAVSYAFCGYAVFASGMYVEYGSMLIVLPLLLTGCERVLHSEKGRSILFFSAFYLGLCGFYFTYMCSVFLAVYVIVRLVFVCGRQNLGIYIKKIAECLFLFAAGLCLSAPVLLPSLLMFLASSRSGISPLAQLLNVSNYIPVLNRRFVSDANIMDSMRNYPVMLSAVCTFFLPHSRRMTQLKIASVSLLVLLYLPITAIVMNGFADPRDRWVFEAQFVLCVVFAVVLDELNLLKKTGLYRTAVAVSLAGIVAAFWTRYSSLGGDQKLLFVTADVARAQTGSVVGASNTVRNDGDLFRISGDFISDVNERPLNDGMTCGYHGVNYWFSIVNDDTQQFVDEASGQDNNWRSYGLGRDGMYETMAGVKYHFSQTQTAVEGYEKVEQITYAGKTWSVFENPKYRGFAWPDRADDPKPGEYADCSYHGNEMSCVINRDFDGDLITALPYSRGWSVTVNGAEASCENSNHFLAASSDGFKKGDRIEFRYSPPGFGAGLAAAAAGLAAFAIRCCWCAVMIRKK